jgi:hypothetical protein
MRNHSTSFNKYNQTLTLYSWTASGRLPSIEEKLMNEFGPFVANTHTETTVSGTAMTKAYHHSEVLLKACKCQ